MNKFTRKKKVEVANVELENNSVDQLEQIEMADFEKIPLVDDNDDSLEGLPMTFSDGSLNELDGFIEGHKKKLNELRDAKLEKNKLEDMLSKERRKNQQLLHKIDNEKNDFKIVKNNYEARMAKLTEGQSSLKTYVIDLNRKKVQVEKEYKRLQNTFDHKANELEQTKKQVDSLKDKIYAIGNSYTGKLETFKNQLNERFSEKESVMLHKFRKMNSDKEELGRNVDDLTVRLSTSEGKNERLRDTISKYQEDLSDLKSKKAEIEKHVGGLNLEIGSLREQLDEYKSLIDEAKIANESYKESYQELKDAFDALNTEKNELSESYEELKLKNEKTQVQLDKSIADFHQLKKAFAKKSFELQNITSEKIHLETVRDEAVDEKVAYETKCIELSDSLETARREITDSKIEIQELTDNIETANSELETLSETKINLETKVVDLTDELEDHKFSLTEAKENLADQIKKHEARDIRESEFITKEQDWISERDLLELKVKDAAEEIQAKEDEVRDTRNALNKLIKKEKEWARHQRELSGKLTAFEEKTLELEHQIEKYETQVKDMEVERQEFESEKALKLKKISELDKKVEEYRIKEVNLTSTITKLQDEKEDEDTELKANCAVAQAELVKVQEQMKEKAMQLKAYKDKLKIVTIKDRTNAQSITDLRASLNDEKKELERTKTELEELHTKWNETKGEYRLLESQLNQTVTSKSDLEEKYVEATKELEEQAALIKKFQDEKQNLEVKIEANAELMKTVQADKESQEQKWSELEKREQKFNYYSRWVDSQKEGLQKHIVRFAQELRTSSSVNPLSSYLSMTEREIDKVRIELNKPSLGSLKRTALEESYKQLSDQKDYVRGLLEKYKSDVDGRVKQVMDLLKYGEFVPVPPLPPKASA